MQINATNQRLHQMQQCDNTNCKITKSVFKTASRCVVQFINKVYNKGIQWKYNELF